MRLPSRSLSKTTRTRCVSSIACSDPFPRRRRVLRTHRRRASDRDVPGRCPRQRPGTVRPTRQSRPLQSPNSRACSPQSSPPETDSLEPPHATGDYRPSNLVGPPMSYVREKAENLPGVLFHPNPGDSFSIGSRESEGVSPVRARRRSLHGGNVERPPGDPGIRRSARRGGGDRDTAAARPDRACLPGDSVQGSGGDSAGLESRRTERSLNMVRRMVCAAQIGATSPPAPPGTAARSPRRRP